MLITDQLIREVLFESKAQTEADIELLEKSAKAQGVPFKNYVLEEAILPDSQLGQLIADKLNLPYINLKHIKISPEVLTIIPEFVARKRHIIIFKKDDKGFHIAMTEPGDLGIVNILKKKLGSNISIYYTTQKAMNEALGTYTKDVSVAFEDLLAENIKQAKDNPSSKPAEPSIIKIVDIIIEYAYKNKASDVHLEPETNYSLLRFRIDGVLHDIVRLPEKIHDQLVTRIKVLSNLRMDTRHIPQDGKIQKKVFDEDLNLRVSIIPVTRGEKVVLRLLAEQTHMLPLRELGFTGSGLTKIQNAYHKPYGMILATGPTGSGKTTSLYAILKDLNIRDVNIMTIEDPVEYDLENVNQIQVNPKVGLTFASGLRSIVRQDPDIILVGEIRDQETAKIAVNSAMTGHLVLSTLHTNDAATAIPRLFDMGVEPFLVSSSVNVIIGQRLVRRVCEECRVSHEISDKDLDNFRQNISKEVFEKNFGTENAIKSMHLYQGKGCEACGHTGYNGRIGIYEVLEVDEQVRAAITSKANGAEIAQIAIKNGMVTMLEDGLEKAKLGLTTIEELIRATKE